MTWKPHSGSLETVSVVKTMFLVQPLSEVQRNKDISENSIMPGRPEEIHLPGHEAFWGEASRTFSPVSYRRGWLQGGQVERMYQDPRLLEQVTTNELI